MLCDMKNCMTINENEIMSELNKKISALQSSMKQDFNEGSNNINENPYQLLLNNANGGLGKLQQQSQPDIGNLLNSVMGAVQNFSGIDMDSINDTYCEFCQKFFCNRYFLRIHKMKRHNICDDEIPSKKNSMDFSMIKKGGGQQNGLNDISMLDLNNLITEHMSTSQATEVFTCDMCYISFDDVLTMIAHKVKDHPQDTSKTLSNIPGAIEIMAMQQSSPSCPPQVVSPSSKSENGSINGAVDPNILLEFMKKTGLPAPFFLQPSPTSSSSNNFPDFNQISNNSVSYNTQKIIASNLQNANYNQQKPIARRSSTTTTDSTGEAYCNMCQKKVCNKYFLRTHMLKMHRVVIDEHKTTIANIDTLSDESNLGLSFRCDICMVNLTSRNELVEHKAVEHNLTMNNKRASPSKTMSDSGEINICSPITILSSENDEDSDEIMMKKIKDEYAENNDVIEQPFELKINLSNDKQESKNILATSKKNLNEKKTKKVNVRRIATMKVFKNFPKKYKHYCCFVCNSAFLSQGSCKRHIRDRHENIYNNNYLSSASTKENLIQEEHALVIKNEVLSDNFNHVKFTAIENNIDVSSDHHQQSNKEESNNSNTSGSVSPSSIHAEEVYGKCISKKPEAFEFQSFVVQHATNEDSVESFSGILPELLKIEIPVKFKSQCPFQLNLKFCPILPTENHH
uniref:C2H2-type domain-containing protein n=1 Tax=Rhabditophanes sp. KR3021 TaxID=114890 RepID=A0AC35U6A2_9BILA